MLGKGVNQLKTMRMNFYENEFLCVSKIFLSRRAKKLSERLVEDKKEWVLFLMPQAFC